MSYKINHYNGTLIVNVSDGTVDNTLDITLVGKNYAGYGATQNENFVYLLENFSNITPPPKPVSGQLWFDSGNKKLKFYDGAKFRTAGGVEIGATEPSGLTVGDFWWDTVNNQLHAYTGNGFALIGPQLVVGAGATEMLSTTVIDVDGISHSIIEAIADGHVVFTISDDVAYELDETRNPITGFSTIRKGLTLAYTMNDNGVTTETDRFFWGTASNSKRLDGAVLSDFVLKNDSAFDRIVNFADVGYTVGNPTPKLKVYNSGEQYPTISNIWNEQINFSTTVDSVIKQTIQLNGTDVLPGTSDVSNIGSSTRKFNSIWATTLNGNATGANTLKIDSTTIYAIATPSPTASTIVSRTSTAETGPGGVTISAGAIKGSYFVGTATTANYADLAENYLADDDYAVGTVVAIGGEKEVTACKWGDRAMGVVSEKPAYLMNSELVGGTPIALKGRVPTFVTGAVKKGQRLIAANDGTAIAAVPHANDVFAIALESSDDTGVKLVECLVL
jgi:hypothetical protein